MQHETYLNDSVTLNCRTYVMHNISELYLKFIGTVNWGIRQLGAVSINDQKMIKILI